MPEVLTCPEMCARKSASQQDSYGRIYTRIPIEDVNKHKCLHPLIKIYYKLT